TGRPWRPRRPATPPAPHPRPRTPPGRPAPAASPPARGRAARPRAGCGRRRRSRAPRNRRARRRASTEVSQVAARAGVAGPVLRLLALDAELDVRHEVETLGRDRLLAFGAQAEALGIVVDAGQRRHDALEDIGAGAVPGRGDALRHLDQGLPVLV